MQPFEQYTQQSPDFGRSTAWQRSQSMTPHRSGAILVCEQASLADPEIIKLCGEIVRSQRAEIARMEAILARY
jgi:uncharacterized protein (DUF305 family)